MSVRHVPSISDYEGREQLVGTLYREWAKESSDAEPMIITEGGSEESPKHIYVVWEAWSDLDQRERSEIIMDTAEKIYPREAALSITVAMGLTREEARRMKMAKALGIE